jgi:hypothetical protein
MMMARYRKKPVEIEAIRWEGSVIGLTNGDGPFPPTAENPAPANLRLEMPEWMPPARVVHEIDTVVDVAPGSVVRQGDYLFIGTLEGTHRADPGDWIIRGIKGELYPCKPDIFAATYEPT